MCQARTLEFCERLALEQTIRSRMSALGPGCVKTQNDKSRW